MSIIKQVKVKQSDGTLKDISIGADAINVSMKNGDSVEKVISSIDETFANPIIDKINETRTILYDNTATTGTVILSDSLSNYQTLEICGYSQHGTQNPVNFKIMMDTSADNTSISVFTYGDESNDYYTNEIITLDKENDRILRGTQYEMQVGAAAASGNIYITKVIGIVEQILQESEVKYTYFTIDGQDIIAEDSLRSSAKLEISGDSEQKTRSGKNLLDGNNPTRTNECTVSMKDNIITISSNSKITTPSGIWEYDTKSGDVFRFAGYLLTDKAQMVFQIYTTQWITVLYLRKSDKSQNAQYTVPSDASKFRVLLYTDYEIPTGASSSQYKDIIVTRNNTDMTYEPYGASPSPEFPSEIECVGDNVNYCINLKGKNNTTLEDGIIKQVTADTKATLEFKVQLYNGTQYIRTAVTETKSGTARHSISFVVNSDEEKYTIVFGLNGSQRDTMCTLITNNLKIGNNTISFDLLNTTQGNVSWTNVKLEKGTKATPYSKYGEGCISIKTENKNYIDADKFPGFVKQADGSYKSNTTITTATSIPLDVPAGKHTISVFIKSPVGKNYRIRWTYGNGDKEFIKVQSTGDYVQLYYRTDYRRKIVNMAFDYSVVSDQVEFKEFMIIDGHHDSDYMKNNYVPHEEQNFIMPLKQVMHKGDYLAEDGIHHKRKTIELTGDENWVAHNQSSNEYKLSNIINGYSKDNKIINNLYCTHFKSIMQEKVFSGQLGIAMLGNPYNAIYISMGKDNTDVTSLTQFKAWLKGQYNVRTPVTIEYELETEEIEPYSEEQQLIYNKIKRIKSYDDVTYIVSQNDIKPNLKFTYRKREID